MVITGICISSALYSTGMISAPVKCTFGVVLSAEPAVGAIAGLLILHEHLTGQQWLAIAAIVAASVGAIATTREPKVGPEPV